MRAILSLADTESGEIAMTILYEGTFTPASHAHQHMAFLQKVMDKIAEKRATDGEHVVDLANLDDTVQQAMETVTIEAKKPVDVLDVLDVKVPDDVSCETPKLVIAHANGQIQH